MIEQYVRTYCKFGPPRIGSRDMCIVFLPLNSCSFLIIFLWFSSILDAQVDRETFISVKVEAGRKMFLSKSTAFPNRISAGEACVLSTRLAFIILCTLGSRSSRFSFMLPSNTKALTCLITSLLLRSTIAFSSFDYGRTVMCWTLTIFNSSSTVPFMNCGPLSVKN